MVDLVYEKTSGVPQSGVLGLNYTTQAYALTQFESWSFDIVGHSGEGVDIDGNGLYDQLSFETTLSVPWSGQYQMVFSLLDQQARTEVLPHVRFATYDATQPLRLDFSGPDLVATAVDDPYVLRLVNVTYISATGERIPLYIEKDIFTSPAYAAAQFQSGGLLPPPDRPTLNQLLNDDGNGYYTISWTPAADAHGYELEIRRQALLATYEPLYTGSVASYEVANQENGTWCYRVRTLRGQQTSSWSSSLCVSVTNAVMQIPTLQAVAAGNHNHEVTWSATQHASSYQLEASPDGTDGLWRTLFNSNATEFNANTLTVGDWCYRVRAAYTRTVSGWSNIACGYAASATHPPTAAMTTTHLYLSKINYPDIWSVHVDSGASAIFFDGSDVGILGADIDAFHIEPDDSILLSFDRSTSLPGIAEAVSDADIVRFIPSTLGENTLGSFELILDGSDVGLDAATEDIDALSRTPDGQFLVSFIGAYGLADLQGDDEDILLFTPQSLGPNSSGSWQKYVNGADLGLSDLTSEDINGLAVDPASGELYLTTYGNFTTADGFAGDLDDVFVCTPTSLGENTSCDFRLFWDGDLNGFGNVFIDALSIRLPTGNSNVPTPTSTPTSTLAPTATPITPTPTMTPLPTATATWTPAPTSTPLPTPTSATAASTCSTGLRQEAEAAQRFGLFTLVSDAWASNGEAAAVPLSEPNTSTPQWANRVEFCLTVTTPGVYHIRGYVLNDVGDSFFVQVDAQPESAQKWSFSAQYVSAYGADTAPLSVELTPGEHMVTVYHRESGARIDALELVLASASATATATLTPTPLPTQTPTAPVATPTSTPTSPGLFCNDGLRQEGESAVLFGAFQLVADAAASGGQAIQVAPGYGSAAVPAVADRAEFCLTVSTAGTYQLLATLLAPSEASNSLYIQVDGQPNVPLKWSIPADASGYQMSAPILDLDLTPGQHVVTILHREAGVRLDQLQLVLISATSTSTPTPAATSLEPTATPEAAMCSSTLAQEGKNAQLFGAFEQVVDANAAGEKAIYVPESTSDFGTPNLNNRAEFCLIVSQAGDYQLNAQIFAPDAGSNSLFVQVDGQPIDPAKWTIPVASTTYQTVAAPLALNLGSGQHMVTIVHREAGTRIDKVWLELNASAAALAVGQAQITYNGNPEWDDLIDSGKSVPDIQNQIGDTPWIEQHFLPLIRN